MDDPINRPDSRVLLTDLYQLTMAAAYWKSGIDRREAVFHLVFRECPFRGGFALAAGLEQAIDFLSGFRFQADDLHYLSGLNGSDGTALFEEAFLQYLGELRFTCDVDAMPEGTPVFPHEPMIRIRGPVVEAQLVETPLLTILNFQSLVATKAARMVLAARGKPIMEFGLRRAQGFDGALSASRAAYIGGCASTSNVMAGRVFGIPVSGTHAHSWVMAFEQEIDAFLAYAAAMPNNCVLLVDTYNTLKGVDKAIRTARWLEGQGKKLVAVRIDSGDLAYLSQKARQMLDAAGLRDVKIVASNDIDEHILESLYHQEADIDLWGIGTRLVTAYDQPALGGVYKLSAFEDASGILQDKIKLSEQSLKVNIPGVQQVRRFYGNDWMVADAIYDVRNDLTEDLTLVDPGDSNRHKKIRQSEYDVEDLLVPVYKGGELIYRSPELADIRSRSIEQLKKVHPGVLRLVNPHAYVVGLEEGLHQQRQSLMLSLRAQNE